MKRRTFSGALFTGPVAAALARTLPKVEQSAPVEPEPIGADFDLGDYSHTLTIPSAKRVSVEIGGTTYYLLAYD